MSLLNVNATEREPISHFNSLPLFFAETSFVGCINGLICLCGPPPLGVTLWNPAMNLYKVIKLPISDEEIRGISVEFAYDSVNDDYKIIRIQSHSPGAVSRYSAEVYSVRLDSWKRVHIDFEYLFSVPRTVIVKGNPYWRAVITHCNFTGSVLLYYDTRDGSFKYVLHPELARHGWEQFVEWKGNIGMILLRERVISPSVEGYSFVDILVYDEMGMCWNKISSHGVVGLKIVEALQCSEVGVILAKTKEGKLTLFDPVTNNIKTFCIPAALEHLVYDASSYIESLVTFKEMEQVKELENDTS